MYLFQERMYFCPSLLTIIKRIMKELVEKLSALCAEFAKDASAQVENGNKAAGTRARKVSLEIEKAMKEFRKVSIEESKK